MALATPDIDILEDTDTSTDEEQVWKVVVHNDDITLFSYVIMLFQQVLTMDRETAERKAHEIHTAGRSVVWSGEREKAETYAAELRRGALRAVCEQ